MQPQWTRCCTSNLKKVVCNMQHERCSVKLHSIYIFTVLSATSPCGLQVSLTHCQVGWVIENKFITVWWDFLMWPGCVVTCEAFHYWSGYLSKTFALSALSERLIAVRNSTIFMCLNSTSVVKAIVTVADGWFYF